MIREIKVEKLVTRGCIVFPRALCLLGALCTLDVGGAAKTSSCEASARFGSPQLSCGCVPKKSCKGLRNPPRRIPIVEGEPNLWLRFIGE